MSSIKEHAEREMRAAGLYDSDADYGTMIPDAVMELVDRFAAQGHSGGSASMVLAIFLKVATQQNLTPLTDNPEEWHFHDESVAGFDGGFWQNNRNGEAFSHDGGKTYYLLSEGGSAINRTPLHTSEPHKKENI